MSADAPKDAPIAAGSGPTKPSSVIVPSPEFSQEETNNAKFSGTRGADGTNNILQSDGSSGSCVLVQAAKGDIFIEAASTLQSECNKRVEHTSTDTTVYTTGYKFRNAGASDLQINKDITMTTNANYTLTVIGTHKEEVKDQVIIAQSQKVDVAGDQAVSVYGNQTNKVGADRTTIITGKDDTKVMSDCKAEYYGVKFESKLSLENELAFGEKTGIFLGGKGEAHIGFAEKLDVAGCTEQTFAIKNVKNFGLVKERTAGRKMGTNTALDITDDTVAKQKARMSSDEVAVVKMASQFWKLGAKICMLD